jgi:Ca2+-binding RTX toxin-like protein
MMLVTKTRARVARLLLVQALAAAAVMAGPASAALGAPVTKLYSTGNLTTPIPDASVLPLNLPVAYGASVLDVNVHIRVDHAFMNDLTIYLQGPDRTVSNLTTLTGGAAGSYGGGSADCNGSLTVFDDEAATSINSGSSPFAGSFQPEDPPLSVFDGKRSDGDWKLLVFDTGHGDVGTMFCWKLEITLDLCPGFEAVEANHFVGTSGNDTLTGTAKKDIFCAGAGEDVLTGSTGDDTLDGGAGTDRLVESADVNFTLTNTALTGLGTDTLSGIEQASLTAGPGHNDLDASAFTGAATLKGEGGDDVLIGGTANDTLDGGPGFDLLIAAANVDFTLTNTSISGLGTDTLAGIEEAFLAGGPGNNMIHASGFSGFVTLVGGSGADHLIGGKRGDLLLGGRGRDHLDGGRGNDQLHGGRGNDDLLGGRGNDKLHGGRGNDDLLGGRGNDKLVGGQNIDACDGGPGKAKFQGCESRSR